MGKRNKGKRQGAQRTAQKTEKKAEKRAARERAKYEDTVEAALLAISGRDAETLQPVHVARPSPRQYCSLVATPATGRASAAELLMFGGELLKGGKHSFFRDLHRLSVAKGCWTRHCTVRSPTPRCSHQCVCVRHGGRDAMFLFGGEFSSPDGEAFRHFGDLWRFDIDANVWELVCDWQTPSRASKSAAAASATPTQPSPRSGHRMAAYKNRFLVLFGGYHEAATRCRYHNDLWLYDLDTSRWMLAAFPESLPRPEPRSGGSIVVNGDELLVFGGFTRRQRPPQEKAAAAAAAPKKGGKKKQQQQDAELDELEAETGVFLNDVWSVDLAQVVAGLAPSEPGTSEAASASASAEPAARWERVKADGVPPVARTGMCSVLFKKHVYFFGGVCDSEEEDGGSSVFNELINFNLEKKKWFISKLKDPARVPVPRYGAQAAIIGSTMYVFGGIVEQEDGAELTLDDLHSLDLNKREGFVTLLASTVTDAELEKVDDDDDDEGEEEEGDGDHEKEGEKEEASGSSSSSEEEEEEEEEEEKAPELAPPQH